MKLGILQKEIWTFWHFYFGISWEGKFYEKIIKEMPVFIIIIIIIVIIIIIIIIY